LAIEGTNSVLQRILFLVVVWVTLPYAVELGSSWLAAGIGRVVRRALLMGALYFTAADIFGFILDRRPH
jgi:hypothetical protein